MTTAMAGAPRIQARRQSTVVAVGVREDGFTCEQEVPLEHNPAPDAIVIGAGFAKMNQVGGFMKDGLDGQSVEFYPLASFKKVTFSLKKVSLATVGAK